MGVCLKFQQPLSGEMKLVLAVCLTLAFQSDAASLRRSGRSKLTFIEVKGGGGVGWLGVNLYKWRVSGKGKRAGHGVWQKRENKI